MSRTTRKSIKNGSSKTGSRRQSRKSTILKHFLKDFFKGKSSVQKLTKSAEKSLSQPWCSHSTTFYDIQLQKTILSRTQPWRQATWTQPWQCVLQHQVANPHLSTHMATQNDSNHAAITLRSATRESSNAKNYAPMNTTTRCSTQWRNRLRIGSTAPAPAAHTRYLSSPAAATLDGKTHGFVLRLSPQIKPHATFMQPSQCVLQAKIPKHHVTAMCKKKQNTSKQPLQCRLLRAFAEPSPRRTHEVPFIAGCNHFTRKNTRFRAPAFSPNQTPCNIHAAITMRICKQRFQNTM